MSSILEKHKIRRKIVKCKKDVMRLSNFILTDTTGEKLVSIRSKLDEIEKLQREINGLEKGIDEVEIIKKAKKKGRKSRKAKK